MTSVQGIATLMAVDGMEGDPDTFYGAAGINGKGSGLLESHDGGDKYDTDVPQGGMMDLGIAVSKDGETLCMSGMNTFVRAAGAEDFVRIDDTISGMSQTVVATDKGFGSAGGWQRKDGFKVLETVNGVIVSNDNGVTWDMFDIGANITDGYYARYAAFPTDDTWYVSSGTWPMDEEEVKEQASADSPLTRHLLRSGALRTKVVAKAADAEGDGYVGGVFKTTDGGKTFSEVLNTHGEFYFNDISCFDADNCIVAAEGKSSVGYHTTDGGASWKMIVDTDTSGSGSSMMATTMISTTEFWFAGGLPGVAGYFYHSTDGETVEKMQLEGAYCMDLTFRGGAGYAAVMSRQTCGVAKYVE